DREVIRMLPLRSSENVDGLVDLAETEVEGPEIGGIVGGRGLRLESPGVTVVLEPLRTRGNAGAFRYCDLAEEFLVEKVAAPLDGKVGVLLAGIVEAGAEGGGEREEKEQRKQRASHALRITDGRPVWECGPTLRVGFTTRSVVPH